MRIVFYLTFGFRFDLRFEFRFGVLFGCSEFFPLSIRNTAPKEHQGLVATLGRLQAAEDIKVPSGETESVPIVGVSTFTDTGTHSFPGRQIFHIGARPSPVRSCGLI